MNVYTGTFTQADALNCQVCDADNGVKDPDLLADNFRCGHLHLHELSQDELNVSGLTGAQRRFEFPVVKVSAHGVQNEHKLCQVHGH